MSLCIVLVGETETGKTYEAIRIATDLQKKYGLRDIIANDAQMEYKYRINKKIKNIHCSEDEWIALVNRFNYNSSRRIFIWDEAGDSCPLGVGRFEVKKPIRGKRFSGNVFLLNFHDLMEVPKYVIRFADYFSVGKSAGTASDIKKKYGSYPHIYEAWLEAMKHPVQWHRPLVKKVR